jgi:hypothetical protein
MEAAGRDPAELVVSMLWAFTDVVGAEQAIDALGEYRQAGLDHMIGIPPMRSSALSHLAPADLLRATLDNMAAFAAEVLPATR